MKVAQAADGQSTELSSAEATAINNIKAKTTELDNLEATKIAAETGITTAEASIEAATELVSDLNKDMDDLLLQQRLND